MMRGHSLRHVVLILCVTGTGAAQRARSADTQAQVQIHLPREVAVQDSALTLGTIAVVRGDPVSVETANRIGLGSLVIPGQRMTIDRTTLLSRLAAHGILASGVTFTGADRVLVGRSGKTLLGADLAEAARQFIENTSPSPKPARIEVVSPLRDLTIDGNHPGMHLAPRLAQGSHSSGSVRVRVAAVCGNAEIAGQEILLRLRYTCRKVVAVSDLAKDMAISAENVRIEDSLSDQAQPVDWRPPYGRVLKRALTAGSEVREEALTEPAQGITAIRRNETVVIRVQRPGLLITAQGKMMTDGRAGDTVKVRNTDSNRIVLCKVKADGSVEPLL